MKRITVAIQKGGVGKMQIHRATQQAACWKVLIMNLQMF